MTRARLATPTATLSVVAALSAIVLHAGAQGPVTAEDVAARVQAFYERTTTIGLDFQQDHWSDAYRRTTTSRGRLLVARPGRFRFDYASGLVMIGDGDRVLSYEPGEDGAPAQFWRGTADAASLGVGFLTGASRLDPSVYTLALASSDPSTPPSRCAGHCDVLVLRPRAPSPHYVELRLHVSHAPGAEGVVLRVTVVDHEGDWNAFTFLRSDFSADAPDSTFELTPPAGAREIDPRGEG